MWEVSGRICCLEEVHKPIVLELSFELCLEDVIQRSLLLAVERFPAEIIFEFFDFLTRWLEIVDRRKWSILMEVLLLRSLLRVRKVTRVLLGVVSCAMCAIAIESVLSYNGFMLLLLGGLIIWISFDIFLIAETIIIIVHIILSIRVDLLALLREILFWFYKLRECLSRFCRWRWLKDLLAQWLQTRTGILARWLA